MRKEVKAFAHMMEAKLKKNDHKRGWKIDSTLDLYWRLREEIDELFVAILSESTSKDIADEATDVANFAMMIADVSGGLDAAL